ncbi:LOW QUALITY PROTEIN: hypothetical protein U9M48_025031 [Paspalum notatum var. saurae]|uniref:Uncharacterized protein n=1 Tax=Paspalum notatum var. saurae TaxID=547442 RepID=A0AAQ3TPR0_PASNO
MCYGPGYAKIVDNKTGEENDQFPMSASQDVGVVCEQLDGQSERQRRRVEAGEQEHEHQVERHSVRHERLLLGDLLNDVVQEVAAMAPYRLHAASCSRHLYRSLPLLQHFPQHLHCTLPPLKYAVPGRYRGKEMSPRTKSKKLLLRILDLDGSTRPSSLFTERSNTICAPSTETEQTWINRSNSAKDLSVACTVCELNTYRGDGLFQFDGRHGGPGAEGAPDGVLDVADHGLLPEALRAEVAEHHVLEVLERGALLLPDVVPAQDLHEGVRVPALEQLPLLLEHHVVELLVRRHHHRVPHQARLEDRPVPKLALHPMRRECCVSPAHLPVIASSRPVPDETRDVEGGLGGEELQRLADERQAHGARRQPADASRVPPPVRRVQEQQQQQHKEHQGSEGPRTGEPHAASASKFRRCGKSTAGRALTVYKYKFGSDAQCLLVKRNSSGSCFVGSEWKATGPINCHGQAHKSSKEYARTHPLRLHHYEDQNE